MTDPNSGSQLAGPEDKTTVLPETAVALVEMERLQQELVASEERARSHSASVQHPTEHYFKSG